MIPRVFFTDCPVGHPFVFHIPPHRRMGVRRARNMTGPFVNWTRDATPLTSILDHTPYLTFRLSISGSRCRNPMVAYPASFHQLENEAELCRFGLISGIWLHPPIDSRDDRRFEMPNALFFGHSSPTITSCADKPDPGTIIALQPVNERFLGSADNPPFR